MRQSNGALAPNKAAAGRSTVTVLIPHPERQSNGPSVGEHWGRVESVSICPPTRLDKSHPLESFQTECPNLPRGVLLGQHPLVILSVFDPKCPKLKYEVF